ncbi:MAG: hypothetical protein F4X30_00530 [Acidimicrobiaceae bacterium]|nr:hypothetical protein [Acidimicrobiaceae bacterium]
MQLPYLDRYEVKARLLPALLSCLVAVPGIGSLLGGYADHADELLVGGGLTGIALTVGLAYLAAAAGRIYERKIWHDWPHDAPTNRWLQPDDDHCSKQQKEIYYNAIHRILGLDIAMAAESDDELRQVINDAVRGLRSKFRALEAQGLLNTHNEDYGFVRNLAGLYFIWVPASVLSAAAAWGTYARSDTGLMWGILASIVLVLAFVLLASRRGLVTQRAERYAESFFGTLIEVDKRLRSQAIS